MTANNEVSTLRLGLPVWGHKPWKGEFFAAKTQPAQFLQQYASVFNAVEGNTTFYGKPQQNTVDRWKRQTPETFKFCFKLPKWITHGKELKVTDSELTQFFSRIEPLGQRIGPFMIQLPASFGPDSLDVLRRFISRLPHRYLYGLEVRNHDFFDQGQNEGKLNRLLSAYSIDRIVFDTRKLHSAGAGDEELASVQRKKPLMPVRFATTGAHPILRYVGVNDKLNNASHLKEWAIVVADWIQQGYHPYVFIHAPDEFYAPRLADYFYSLLQGLIKLPARPSWPALRGGDGKDQLALF